MYDGLIKLDLPKDFLMEEVRCGYTVSRQMKEVWAVQLDLFAEFDRVCRKHILHQEGPCSVLLVIRATYPGMTILI